MENTVNYLPQGCSLSAGPSPRRWCAVRPNCLLTSWAKIGAITPGPERSVSPLVLRLLFRTGGRRQRRRGLRRGLDNNTRARKISREGGTLEEHGAMDIGARKREEERRRNFEAKRQDGKGWWSGDGKEIGKYETQERAEGGTSAEEKIPSR